MLLRFAALSLSLALAAPAQRPADPPAAPLAGACPVPIHTAPGAYGTWAMGPRYKVSFDDGFELYPLLGSRAPRSLPLRWRPAATW